MGKFSENLGKAADNAERLASALQSLPAKVTDSSGGGGGGAGGGQTSVDVASGFRAPTQAVFNTTVNLEGTGGGGGAGGSERSRPNNGGISEEIIRAFAYYGIAPGNKSPKYIEQILKMFREMKRGKNFDLMMRTEGL